MEIGPIFRALMHNKSRFWLVTLEVALTLAIVANCVNMMLDMRHEYLRPSGYDEENLIAINTEPFALDFEDEEFADTIREEDLRRLEAVPGVRGAIAINQVPLSGSGSSTGRNGSGGRQRLRDVFAGQLDRLLRRVERGGISSLELHRTLRALKAALPRL